MSKPELLILAFAAVLLAPHASFGQPRVPGGPYESIRRDIESAGRQGSLRRLERLVDAIDHELAKVTPIEQTACWQLLKGAAMVELGRPSDAKAIFSVLVDTCPIWEVFNNLAVLEATDGEFGPAKENLLRALDRAESTEPAEASLPRGNLRKILEQPDELNLTLAGFAKECIGTTIPLADCVTAVKTPR